MKSLIEVAQIIKQVMETASKKEKELVISQHEDNELFKKVLNHLFNPYVKTNIAQKKLSKKVDLSTATELIDVDDFIGYLCQSSGKDENIATVQKFISDSPKEIQWLLEGMAIKKLKIGATGNTINKAFGYQFIPSFDLMLSEKYVDVKKDGKIVENWKKFEGKDVIATKKVDGYRCVAFVRNNGDIDLYSREGNLYEGCTEIEEALSLFPKGYAYDGELLATNEEGLSSEDLFKKTSSVLKKNGIKKGLEFQLFDLVPIASFESGGDDRPTIQRKDELNQVIKMIDSNLIVAVPTLYVGKFNKDIIDKLSDEAKANKEEGIMVQLAYGGYKCARTKEILKVKTFESADVRCLDMYEGLSDSTKGKLGGIIVDYKGFRVKVGGGFSKEAREEYWKDPSLIIGKIVEIKYFNEFVSEEGDIDLRFAHFKCVRDEKSEPSYY